MFQYKNWIQQEVFVEGLIFIAIYYQSSGLCSEWVVGRHSLCKTKQLAYTFFLTLPTKRQRFPTLERTRASRDDMYFLWYKGKKRAGEELSSPFTDHFLMRQPVCRVSAEDGSVKEHSCTSSNCPRMRTGQAARDTETLSFLWDRGLSHSVFLALCYATNTFQGPHQRNKADFGIWLQQGLTGLRFHLAAQKVCGSNHPDSLMLSQGKLPTEKVKVHSSVTKGAV